MVKRTLIRGSLFFLSFALGVLIFVFLLSKEGVPDILGNLRSFGFLPFVGFVLISLLNFGLYSWRWQLITNAHLPKKSGVSFFHIYLDRMAGFSASYLTPAAQVGGEPVRIAMLASERKVPLRQATSSVVLDVAFEMMAYFAFILAGSVLAVASGFGGDGSFLIIFAGLAIGLLFLGIFFFLIATGKGFFRHFFNFFQLKKIRSLEKAFKGLTETEDMMTRFLRGHPKLVFGAAVLSLVMIFFRVVEVFYISNFFGVDLRFSQAFLMSTLPGVALILPVPAGLGVFEGSFAALFSLLAIPLNPISFTLIIRSRDIVFIGIGLVHMLSKGRAFVERKILRLNEPNR